VYLGQNRDERQGDHQKKDQFKKKNGELNSGVRSKKKGVEEKKKKRTTSDRTRNAVENTKAA